MKSVLKKENIDQHTGYLGTSRVVLNHFDVSTQADIQHHVLSYGSEDEIMGRFYGKDKRRASSGGPSVAHYSKQDIREQYCISEKGLGALEADKHSIFGCISSHHSSPCSSKSASSFLTSCVKPKITSDENIYELYKRHPSEYAPYPKRHRYPWAPLTPEILRHDQELRSSYFRRQVHADPNRYTWMPSDDESIRMEKPKSILDVSHRNQVPLSISSVQSGKKHVSFARSHTLTSFDDAMSSLSSSSSHLNRITRSQERLLDVRKVEAPHAITKQPEFTENIVILDKIKRAPMKTQATQTEVGLGRKPITTDHINLSPRTIQRVKMVSQGAQTNGFNGKKLSKSFSEAGTKFAISPSQETHPFNNILDHEPLHRTQSDEPPRSPFMVTSSSPTFRIPENPPTQSEETSSLSRSEDHESEDSVETKKEIFIDFKPQVPESQSKFLKRPLIKTASDGLILIDQRKMQQTDDSVVPTMRPFSSISQENIQVEVEQKKFAPSFQNVPIRNEGICNPPDDNIYSSVDGDLYRQDSIDEEFHENIIYNKMYISRQESHDNKELEAIKEGNSPTDESIVPSIYLETDMKLSPFTSNDSLANDARDQSDGIWNESQVTVLQVDSGTDNGTALSSSEIASITSPGSLSLLTPSSKRKHLLMLQHQQRSSMDSEALDEELMESETYPKIVVDKPSVKLELPVPLQTDLNQSSLFKIPQKKLLTLHKRKVSETPPLTAESPLPAVVPDILLARTDSCKTNTDVSESTTTDDYITANSGTDSSRKSGSYKGHEKQLVHQQAVQEVSTIANTQEGGGSSFDSAKGSLDTFVADDMVVPSLPISLTTNNGSHPQTTSRSACQTPVSQIRVGRTTPSDDSSSCGSYSVGGSTADLLESFNVPSTSLPKVWHASDDEERSAQYSSSGYYESPMEDDFTWKSPSKEDNIHTKKRREFHLDLANAHKENNISYNKSKQKYCENKSLPNSENLKVSAEKGKRSKSRTRSPMQGYKKNFQGKKSPYKDKSPYLEEKSYRATSDESSTGREYPVSQTSPRKMRKNKENNRRKSLPRSPTSQKNKKKNETDIQSSSLPNSLSRRKSNKQLNKLQVETVENNNQSLPSKRHSPSKSPQDSLKDAVTLKALSAESLRSVSPGSDSVFFSDPSSHMAEHQIHCLHCGKEVDAVSNEDTEKTISNDGHYQDIVQPPAGFEDSPKSKPERLFKKIDKRIKSEERGQLDHRRYRYKPDVRAKSEERGGSTASSRSRLRPMARSPFCSRERLQAADSSPSVLPGAPDEDDDNGLYDASYFAGTWLYIDERDDVQGNNASSPAEETNRCTSTSSTESEQEFRKRYQAVTHRMVHRKSCLEMYKRQNNNAFEEIRPYHTRVLIKENLEELFKLMLIVWCRQSKALYLTNPEHNNECDKTIVVHRESGEFGFRIHGSKPVVVSAIEAGTPAESSGLEVGDIVLAVNGVNVLEKSHSEVVKIAHARSDTLTLEVARTCYALNTMQNEQHNLSILYSGYLWKSSGYASGNTTNKWIRRWFCLKQNHCLYYYKTDSEKQPVGVLMLFNYKIRKLKDDEGALLKPHRFVIESEDSVPLHLAADNDSLKNKWVEVIEKAINDSRIVDEFMENTKKNLGLAPSNISEPDCFGYLIKLGTQWKSWSRRYCVLKDACLYFYNDANAKSAFGVAYLHGYKVQQSFSGSKKHAFEIIPSDSTKKYYYFYTESEADRRRWITALEYSIDRWLKMK